MDKDDYVLKAHVRHEKKDILDKMMDMPMSMAVKVNIRIDGELSKSYVRVLSLWPMLMSISQILIHFT